MPVQASLPHIVHSPPTGLLIDAKLYYTSEVFVTALRDDIKVLLAAFEAAWAAQKDAAGDVLPYHVFKDVWKQTGWIYIHLSITEPALRHDWARLVYRGF